jgi:hypothetical protein
VSVACGFAQTSGEISDVLAKMVVALQQWLTHFLHRVSFALHFDPSAGSARVAEKPQHRISYYFSMQTTAIVHRRYMSRLVMLTH